MAGSGSRTAISGLRLLFFFGIADETFTIPIPVPLVKPYLGDAFACLLGRTKQLEVSSLRFAAEHRTNSGNPEILLT
jgi:hypothetical protein